VAVIGFICSTVALLGSRLEPSPDPSSELVRCAAAGDRDAFDELYRMHAPTVQRLLLRLVGPVPDLDDLLQHAFLDAFRALPKFRGEAAFSTWLHRIAVHTAYRYLRKHRRVRHEAVSDEVIGDSTSPDLVAHRHQELARALAYLSALKPKKRIAFVLRVVEGMSLDEIGALVGATAAAVGQRVKYARKELAAMVERDRLRSKEEP
jgi:RNA polymerase sigma-70 factor (ECF subfamily)